MIRIHISSVIVDDQDRAEAFYVGKLGFRKKQDFPAGGGRWLTVENADGSGVELALEPSGYEFSKAYQAQLFAHGIPITSLAVDDLDVECERLRAAGVVVRGTPEWAGHGPPMTLIEDGCGNLLLLIQL